MNHAAADTATIDVDWPHRQCSRFVEAGGLSWHVQRMGRGVPLLLLHGAGASTHSWRDLMPRLAERCELVAVDLPGHGFSGTMPRDRRSMAGMAAACGELLRALRFAPRTVVGHSAGAALAVRMTLDGVLSAPMLIGVNAALLPFDGVAGVLYAPIARLLALNPLVPWLASWRAQDDAGVRRLIEATGSHLDDAGVRFYARLLRNPDHVSGVLTMMSRWDLPQLVRELPALRARLHLLVGEHDAAVPPAHAVRVAAMLPATSVEHLAGTGHLAHEEKPAQVVERVLAWIDGEPAAGRR